LKILIILSRFPWPLDKGDKLRAFHFLRCLAREHTLYLFALSDQFVSEEAIRKVAPYCQKISTVRLTKWDIFRGLLFALSRRLPLQIGYFRKRQAMRQIDKLAAEVKPDVVLSQLVRSSVYNNSLPGIKIIDYQDALSLNMLRRAHNTSFPAKLLFRREACLLKRYERAVFDNYHHRIIISEPDRMAIDHPDNALIQVVPNGVDFDYFAPGPTTFQAHDIVFTGNMSYAPNISGAKWLAKEILPKIRNHRPGTTLLIAGASPAHEVRLLSGAGVTVTGWLPDIREAYRCARIFIAPMLTGSGLQNKLLEAMSTKLPCITTPIANNALGAVPGTHILVGESAEEISAHAVKLLSSPEHAQHIALAGYQWVHETYRWENQIERLSETIINLKNRIR